MRRLITLILLAFFAVALSLTAKVNTGQVAVFFSPYRIDLSLNLVIAGLFVGFLLFYGIVRAVYVAIGLPERVREFKLTRRREGAHNALRASVMALTEGRLTRVEHLATEAQVFPADGLPAALLAAMAAHRLKQYERRDKWLQELSKEEGEVGLAANLMAAEFLEEQGRFEDAEVAIKKVLAGNRRNLRAQQVALKVFKASGYWEGVLKVSRLLTNRGTGTEVDLDQIVAEAYRNLIARRSQVIQQIWQLWRNATPRELGLLDVTRAFVYGFSRIGAPSHARALIENYLKNQWNGELVQLFAEIFYSQPLSTIKTVEEWKIQHPDDPHVLRALGLLHGAIENWSESAASYERLFAIQPSPEIAAQLARVYSRSEDAEREAHYRTTCVALLLKV